MTMLHERGLGPDSPRVASTDSPSGRTVLARASLVGIVALAAALRTWHVGSQIPFDDEWHALAYVAEHDLGFLITHYTRLGANSIPYNLYLRLVQQTVGLSEWSIVLPSLLSGVLLVAMVSHWVWDRLGRAAGVVAGIWLAFAPFLTFYGRLARPYAPALLLEFSAIAALLAWMRTGGRARALAAIAFAALAVWTHLTAAPPLLGAFCAGALWQWRQGKSKPSNTNHRHDHAPGALGVLTAAAAVSAIAALLDWPAIMNASNPAEAAFAPFTWRTAGTLSQLVCGTGYLGLRLLVGAAAAVGLVIAAKRTPRELAVLGAAALTAVTSVLVGHPLQSEIGAIFARYSLPIFLVIPLLIGATAQWLIEQIESAPLRRVGGTVGVAVLAAALYFAGPLPFIFTDHASFTKHPVFQYEYREPSRERTLPDPVGEGMAPLFRGQLHPFYARLPQLAQRDGAAPIIEYPFVVGEDNNRFYFAQMVHGRPVLAGYYASGAGWADRFGLDLGQAHAVPAMHENPGFLVSDMTIDHALGRLRDRSGIRFRTVVDLGDTQAIRSTGAAFVILHWNVAREFLRLEVDTALGDKRGRFVATLRDRLQAELGPPLFEDGVQSVFAVR